MCFCPFNRHILKYRLTDRNLLDRIMCMSRQCYQPHLIVPWEKKKTMCYHVCIYKSTRRKNIYCMSKRLISKIWCYSDISNVKYSFVLDRQQSDTERGWGVWGPRGFKNFKFIFCICSWRNPELASSSTSTSEDDGYQCYNVTLCPLHTVTAATETLSHQLTLSWLLY